MRKLLPSLLALAAFLASPVGARNDGSRVTGEGGETPQTLSPIIASSERGDESYVRARCYAFFVTVRVYWQIARGYGDERDVLQFANDVDIEQLRGEGAKKLAFPENMIGKYLDTFGGVWPTRNARHPVFIADKAFCMELAGISDAS